ncbi:DUF1289 domain-containing protein [Hylemonella gracilis]|uniref:DUF1289 domain-containing protein n=1 Tax=Hylemonella gracilis TaxID=80880 RepID=A0A4P6UG80_9BURK|nr:DUF1289 domain-containing protein [Hylemonella gracilis]QBK04238.1 DUF1289 domain-containing protein [Hylemonella gracilis]
MMDKQGQARLAERVRRHYLPPSDLPVFCTLCKVSTTTGLCPVCLRSLEEITNWPRLDDEHRRTVWGRVLTRLDDAREHERTARRRGALRRSAAQGELPPEPTPVDEVLFVADSGAQTLAQEGQAHPLEPDTAAPAMPASDAAQTREASPGPADTPRAQGPAEELVPAIPPLAPAPGEASTTSAEPVPDPPPRLAVAAQTSPASAIHAAVPAPPVAPPETLTHGGVPVDVAAARARQVRLAMAQVVQASLESARREQAKPSPGPEEIRLEPLI